MNNPINYPRKKKPVIQRQEEASEGLYRLTCPLCGTIMWTNILPRSDALRAHLARVRHNPMKNPMNTVVQVLYSTNFRESSFWGYDFEGKKRMPSPGWIEANYRTVATLRLPPAADKVICEKVFESLNLNPREYIKYPLPSGVQHTSMSVGDILVVNGTGYLCVSVGFEEIEMPLHWSNPIDKDALKYRAMYKGDLKAGHKEAAQYWKGAAAAAFTANPIGWKLIAGRGSLGEINWGVDFKHPRPLKVLKAELAELKKHYGEKVLISGGGGAPPSIAILHRAEIVSEGFIRPQPGQPDIPGLKAYLTIIKGDMCDFDEHYNRTKPRDFDPWIDSWQISVPVMTEGSQNNPFADSLFTGLGVGAGFIGANMGAAYLGPKIKKLWKGKKNRKENPFLESVVSGLGVGLGWAGAGLAAKAIAPKVEKAIKKKRK